jgi:dihydroorotase
LRDGAALQAVLPDTARQMARALIMPNLKPPVTSVALANAYRERILAACPLPLTFQPFMTLYLTGATTAADIIAAKASGVVQGIKHYPAGATTNSEAGVANILACEAVLEAMQEVDLPLLIHGEVTDADIDIFDREAVFITRTLIPLLTRFPKLRVVLEHITTQEAAEFVATAPTQVAATITAHHLLLNRNAMLAGGIRPHYYCLPILKRETHRQALIQAAISGSPKFFLGTDSAPHPQGAKESACGCAGIYTAHAAIELYAEAFERAGALDKLEGFASHFGADFYRLPRNQETITLEKHAWKVPAEIPFADGMLIPHRAGELVLWRLK